MTALIILAGIVWIIYQVCKDSSIKQVPKGTDPIQVNSDRCSGKYTDKEMNQRIYSGNWKLEQEDANKVRFGEMSRSQFIKNMNNGKYR